MSWTLNLAGLTFRIYRLGAPTDPTYAVSYNPCGAVWAPLGEHVTLESAIAQCEAVANR